MMSCIEGLVPRKMLIISFILYVELIALEPTISIAQDDDPDLSLLFYVYTYYSAESIEVMQIVFCSWIQYIERLCVETETSD